MHFEGVVMIMEELKIVNNVSLITQVTNYFACVYMNESGTKSFSALLWWIPLYGISKTNISILWIFHLSLEYPCTTSYVLILIIYKCVFSMQLRSHWLGRSHHPVMWFPSVSKATSRPERGGSSAGTMLELQVWKRSFQWTPDCTMVLIYYSPQTFAPWTLWQLDSPVPHCWSHWDRSRGQTVRNLTAGFCLGRWSQLASNCGTYDMNHKKGPIDLVWTMTCAIRLFRTFSAIITSTISACTKL